MIIARKILELLDQKGELTQHDLYMEVDDPRTSSRIELLLKQEDIKRVGTNRLRITEKGKTLLRKLL
ncbi:hypothetical protein [Ammoniphilus sp. CFH 90114]|uniref:hypothetical protein n=1 Tax=Ammoniphilus sp. CFH 90114 TaxID=2493665 RepID=UPI00100F41F4|nr:hypothetical protein [Ammoniphilus sp. CFH 90114]RXT02877.1 hypothetical protein EIZ39_24105 [Ammoniphilus sp. CFH 90114]